MKRPTGRQVAALSRRLRREGARSTLTEAGRRTLHHLGGDGETLPLDALLLDPTPFDLPWPTHHLDRAQSASIGFVCTPPGPGSGGHTTLFRMVRALEAHGHRCILYLYDRHSSGDVAHSSSVIRKHWPQLEAEVRDAGRGIRGVDACVASSWETAYVVASRTPSPMRRLYFVQDYEPFFYPRGALYSLAEDTYRFGFRTIALGHMVADQLRSQIGLEPDVVGFGCDTDVYGLLHGSTHREGVVFFARKDTPRRGALLAELALERFHQRHPEVPIQVYGGSLPGTAFPVTPLGRLTPAQLNELYNRSVAGVAMSFTNISLVAAEMLAAGTIPVVNDSALARADLDNEYVEWATPTPAGIADALARAVACDDIRPRSERAAASVRSGWSGTEDAVVRIVEHELYGPLRIATPRDSAAAGGGLDAS